MSRRRSLSLALCVLAFAAVGALVTAGLTNGIDRAVYDVAQRTASPTMNVLASAITALGSEELALLFGIAFAVLWARRAGPIGLLPLTIVLVVGLSLVIKVLVPHARPSAGAAVDLKFVPTLLTLPKVTGSFPSNHVLMVAFLGGLVRFAAPRIGWFTWIVIVLVAASRIYLNKHSLTDVIAGGLAGTALALAAVLLASWALQWRAARRAAASGEPLARPDPSEV